MPVSIYLNYHLDCVQSLKLETNIRHGEERAGVSVTRLKKSDGNLNNAANAYLDFGILIQASLLAEDFKEISDSFFHPQESH